MNFIIENFEYIAITVLLVLIVLIVLMFTRVIRISRFFSNRKFRIIGNYELEPQTNKQEFVIRVFNNNVNDSYIVGFGFMYREQTIDFYKTYFAENHLDQRNQFIVLSRDSFKFSISSSSLETIIFDYNQGAKHISKIYVYAIDSQGLVTKSNAKMIRKVVNNTNKANLKVKKQKEEAIRLEILMEKKKARHNARQMKSIKFKSNIQKCFLKIKSLFKKGRKN